MPPHLFVDISAHGLGHLAQAAPVLNALRRLRPGLQLTVRSGLPLDRLRGRLTGDFEYLAQRSDFGFIMRDAVRIDLAATAAAYRAQHADWPQRVAGEAAFLRTRRPDLVLSDVAYLPLAGAAQAGIASLSMCSLNWADLFAHFFGGEDWAAPILAQILAAYRDAGCFLRLTPAMPMHALPRQRAIAPVATPAIDRRDALRQRLRCAPGDRLALVAFGGFDIALAADRWPTSPGLRWLIPQAWATRRADLTAFEPLGFAFSDLLRSVDVVLTKPGYGTFVEAACNATPVLFVRRDDWPEQDVLIDWLKANSRCAEISADDLATGRCRALLESLWRQPPVAAPLADGARQAAEFINARLSGD